MNDSLNEFTSSDDQFDDVTMLVISIKSNELNLNYKNPSFEIIEDAINKFNDKYSYIDKQILSEVNIIFDELLNNYISYEKIDNLEINIDTKIVDDELQLTFINNGVEFNPLLIDDKYIEEYSEDLKLGGFGITIVKNLSKNIEYIRKNNKNILIINKKFAPKLVQN